MPSPHTIPSKIETTGSEVTADSGKMLYITAILKAGDITIGSQAVTIPSDNIIGSLGSPIICDAFTPDSAGQIAYYEI